MTTIAIAPSVAFGGSNLSAEWLAALVELRIERQFQVPGRATLRFSDPGYVLLAKKTASLGTTVRVSDHSGLVLIEAEVTSVAVDQRVGEQPELVVVAHDKSHRLGRSTDMKTYLNMTYSDVASQLAASVGLSPSTDSSSLTIDYLMQADTGLGLITELARRIGFDWWVDETSLHFEKPSSGVGVNLTLGDDLLAFSVKASGHHPDSVTVDGWDRDQQELVTATAESASGGVSASSDLADLVTKPGTAFGTAKLVSAGLSAHSQTEAEQLSQALLDYSTSCSVSAQGSTSGSGQVKPGTIAHISQAGPLSGTYPVTRVEHLFRPSTGFVTRFYAGDRRPTTLVDTLANARLAPATMHPGLSVGQVTNSNDPKNGGRVKVKYPGVSAQYESDWARVVALGGGAGRGSVFIPEVNDEVLVAFEGGDPRQPVVIGGLYGSKSTIPLTSVEQGKVQQRGMTSRLGHVIQLLDGETPEKQAILLQLASNAGTVHLGTDKLSITVPNGTPIEITAGSSSLKFGNDGAVTLSAPTISITGEQKISLSSPQVELNADAQLNLASDGAAALKGATLEIQSEGPLSMTGQPVSIN